MNEHDLLELKEKIETAKTKVAELKGSEKQLMKDLKVDWECITIDEAEKKVSKMEKEIETLNQQIKDGTAELEEKYNIE